MITPSQTAAMAAIEEALRGGRLGVAEQGAAELLRTSPHLPEAWLLSARCHVARARWNEAEKAFARLEELRPGHPAAALARGHFLMRMGRDVEAIKQFRRAAEGLSAGQDEPKAMIAACERRLGNPAKALELLATLPKNATVSMLAATAHLDLDQPAQAEALLRPFVGLPVTPLAKSQLLHVLGQALERLGRHDAALQQYAASKALLGVRFDPRAFTDLTRRLRTAFGKEALATLARASLRSERPVIIAALPRSGTTLLERIIAAHPQCSGAGETDALRSQLTPLNPADPFGAMLAQLPQWTSADLDAMARRYLETTEPFGPGAVRIADKQLENWMLLGLHSVVLPGARAIHIRRDPLDNGLSCFERLSPMAIPWCADLGNIGAVLRDCAETMEHWKRNLDIPILTVEYENLVRNPEPETRRIIDFLGLPWDDACLAHHREPAEGKQGAGAAEGASGGSGVSGGARRLPPPTLGTEQAAKPIYDTSIGRGGRFGPALDPLRHALAGR